MEGRRLQEQKYSLKPEGLEESNFGECKHDIDVEAPSVLDSVENQNLLSFPDKEGKQGRGKAPPESISILASPKRDEKRKRGRPAGPSTKKGKAGFSQVRRTRPRIGKPPKIYENESDASDSGEKMEEEGTKMGGNHAIHGVECKECPEIQETEIVEDSESSQRGKTEEKEVALDNVREKWLDRVQDIELDSENKVDNSKKTEKLEVMVDPVQAMLLDMIPSLGAKKAESTNPIIDDEKPPVEQGAEPVKKKKVSYKDVAGALLKDW